MPLLVKIAPDLADDDVLAVADLALAIGLDGIIATNTTISRDGLRTPAAKVEEIGAGGLSGRPLTARSLEVLRLLRGRVGPDLTLIGVGGITTVDDARARLDAGADLLQGYTAFIYEGPLWPRRIVKGVSPMTFGARLHAAIADRGPFCVGIDPHAALLPTGASTDDVAGLERFALTAVEALAPHVSVVKPQSAFYERFGSRGIAVLERVIAESRAAGALVLLDVKRGDIGSTSQAYADAYLDPASPLASDAITVSPFLGFGSLDPIVDTARAPRRRASSCSR